MEPMPAKMVAPESEEPGLRDYWKIINEGRWIIGLSFLVVVVSTAFFTFTAHPVYQASARILVDTSKLASSDIASLLSPLISGTRNDIQNRIEVMSSPPVLQAAIQLLEANAEFVTAHRAAQENSFWARFWQRLNFQKPKPLATETDGDANPLLGEKELSQNLQIKQVPNTDLIEIKANGGSPKEAQLIANALLQAYTEQDLKFSQATLTNVKEFLQKQLAQMEVRVQQSQETLVDFEKRAGLELNPEDVGKKLLQLETLLGQAKVDLEDKQRQLDAINVMLDQVTTDFLAKETGPERSNIIAEVQLKLDQLRKLQEDIKQLEEKRVKYLEQDNYIMAKQTEDEINAKHQAVEEAARKQLHGFDLLPKYEELIKRQLQTTLEIQALKDRVDVIQQARDDEAKRITDNALQFLQVQQDLESDKNVYLLLREEYEKTRLAEAGQLGGVRVINYAEVPQAPIKPNKGLNLILAAFVGLILGTGVTFLRSYLDNTVKTPKDVERLGLTTLGAVLAIPSTGRPNGDALAAVRRSLLVHFDIQSPEFDAYTSIDAAIRFSELDQPPRTLLITSVFPDEGKSTTAINLALVMARSGKRTLLVDTDLRRASLTKLFRLQKDPGLTELALKPKLKTGDVVQAPYTLPEWQKLEPYRLRTLLVDHGTLPATDWDKAIELQQRERSQRPLEEILVQRGLIAQDALDAALAAHFQGWANFHLLPTGDLPPNAATFLGSGRVQEALKGLRDEFDVVILDSPPIVAGADTLILGSLAEGVLLVVEAEHTAQDAVSQAVEQLGKAGAKVIGAVLNKAKPVTQRYYGRYYGYGYGYGYGYEKEKHKGRLN